MKIVRLRGKNGKPQKGFTIRRVGSAQGAVHKRRSCNITPRLISPIESKLYIQLNLFVLKVPNSAKGPS